VEELRGEGDERVVVAGIRIAEESFSGRHER
jgi:hypothetical protein